MENSDKSTHRHALLSSSHRSLNQIEYFINIFDSKIKRAQLFHIEHCMLSHTCTANRRMSNELNEVNTFPHLLSFIKKNEKKNKTNFEMKQTQRQRQRNKNIFAIYICRERSLGCCVCAHSAHIKYASRNSGNR